MKTQMSSGMTALLWTDRGLENGWPSGEFPEGRRLIVQPAAPATGQLFPRSVGSLEFHFPVSGHRGVVLRLTRERFRLPLTK
jgi:hypothetical protein